MTIEEKVKALLRQRPVHLICDCKACVHVIVKLIEQIVEDDRDERRVMDYHE